MKRRKTSARRSKPAHRRPRKRAQPVAAAPVTAAELRALRDELERRMHKTSTVDVGRQRRAARRTGNPLRWNPEPEEVQKSVVQLVLTLVEFLRRLMERQAIRRMEQKTLTKTEVDAVGQALMQLEATVRDIGKRFGLTEEDLNLDLGPLGTLM